jgi:hypothetical protein
MVAVRAHAAIRGLALHTPMRPLIIGRACGNAASTEANVTLHHMHYHA